MSTTSTVSDGVLAALASAKWSVSAQARSTAGDPLRDPPMIHHWIDSSGTVAYVAVVGCLTTLDDMLVHLALRTPGRSAGSARGQGKNREMFQ